MIGFLRENAVSVAYEIWAAYWFVRCKLAADCARVAMLLAAYCKWRGESAWFAFWVARRVLGLSRWLVPPALRPLTEAVCEGKL